MDVKAYRTDSAGVPVSRARDSRPPVTDRPANAGSGSTSSSSACLISAAEASGIAAR